MNSMNPVYKRWLLLVVGLVVGGALLTFGLYDIIKIDWLSFMEVQASYKPMEEPLPVATGSIPIEGAAFVGGVGDPVNPVEADKASVERGRLLYSVTCIQCHGSGGKGDGTVGLLLVNHPADLTGDVVQNKADGALFTVITNGIVVNGQIHMPALNENLTVRDRWDVINFLRSLRATPDQATPTPKP